MSYSRPPGARRWWALGALVLSILVIGLDTTILNVALPTLSTQLGAGTSDLQWIVAAYIVVFAALLLPRHAAGDASPADHAGESSHDHVSA
ncbi:MAG: transporter [Actinomycetia bacterium]|nr:transporter [Actinomycetes bacterium]